MPAPRVFAPALTALILAAPVAAQQPKDGPPAERVPVLKPLCKFSTTKAPHAEAVGDSSAKLTADWITKFYDKAITDRKAAGRPLISPFVPKVSEPWLIYHSNEGLV